MVGQVKDDGADEIGALVNCAPGEIRSAPPLTAWTADIGYPANALIGTSVYSHPPSPPSG